MYKRSTLCTKYSRYIMYIRIMYVVVKQLFRGALLPKFRANVSVYIILFGSM